MLPNMTYLVGRGGKVLFRADWTDPPTIQWAVQYIQDSRARRRQGFHLDRLYGNCRLSLERSSRRKRRIRTCLSEGCERLRSRYGAPARTRTATRPHRASRDPVIHGFRFLFYRMRCLIPKPSLTQFCACWLVPLSPASTWRRRLCNKPVDEGWDSLSFETPPVTHRGGTTKAVRFLG